jgi:uncharacterized protein YlxW (UPF0749 family)
VSAPDRPATPDPASSADPHRYASVQLLVELVNDTLDPGYAAAAARRGPNPPRRWYDAPAVAIGCLLIGFALVVGYIHTHRSAPEAQVVHDDLVTKVRDAEDRGDDLSAQLKRLSDELEAARNGALSASQRAQLSAAELSAGQVAVTGPGLSVTLDEPPAPSASPSTGRGGTTPVGAAHILTDRDIRSVVNELWADGAEAISVNDVRLTPTSAIRFAGEAVLVDFQAISPPYTIRAVGDADTLATGFAMSEVASRYQTLSSAVGIRFAFDEKGSLTLPASTPPTLRYARPVASSSPSPIPTPTST